MQRAVQRRWGGGSPSQAQLCVCGYEDKLARRLGVGLEVLSHLHWQGTDVVLAAGCLDAE